MDHKRILIVDDDKDILFLLALSMKKLGSNYDVTTALSGSEARQQLQKQKFDLVITDYMMPGMSGLQLAREVQQLSPETQVILMTAYDNSQVRDEVESLDLSGYLGKPFTVPEALKIVKQVVAHTDNATLVDISEPLDLDQAVCEQLRALRAQTGAYYVILIDAEGTPVHVDGQVSPSKAARLAAFVAANFLAVTELAHLLGDNESVFNSIYHEGSKFNIYAAGVNRDMLLAVVFSPTGKPGTVWFYTKQTAAELASLHAQPSQAASSGELSGNLAADFEELLGDEKDDTPI